MSSALLSLPAGLLCHVKMCQRRYSDTAPATARTDSPWSRQIRPRPNKSGAAEPQRQIPRAAGRASFLAATNRPHARFVGEVRPGPSFLGWRAQGPGFDQRKWTANHGQPSAPRAAKIIGGYPPHPILAGDQAPPAVLGKEPDPEFQSATAAIWISGCRAAHTVVERRA